METRVDSHEASLECSDPREGDRLLARIEKLEHDLRHAANQLAHAEARLVELATLEALVGELRRERDRAQREKADAHAVIQSMQRTRLWRTGAAYWNARDSLLGRRSRSTSHKEQA
jgi:hypothetical protein